MEKEFTVRFGTGAGDETGIETLDEAKAYADEHCTYTQTSVVIEDENENEICIRNWNSVGGVSECENPIDFGALGFFGDWE